jgi:hypothetical protein
VEGRKETRKQGSKEGRKKFKNSTKILSNFSIYFYFIIYLKFDLNSRNEGVEIREVKTYLTQNFLVKKLLDELLNRSMHL